MHLFITTFCQKRSNEMNRPGFKPVPFLVFGNLPQWQNIYIAGVQRRGFSLIHQKLSKWRGSELRRFCNIWRYLYNTLSAWIRYEASVLGFWNFPQWQNIYCRCATLRFQIDRTKIVEITGSTFRRFWDIWGYFHNTLSAALWYEAFGLGFWNFPQ